MPDLEDFLNENQSLLLAESIPECLELLSSLGRLGGPFYYYRGVPDSDYRLLTALDRMLHVQEGPRRRRREHLLISQFKKVAHNHLPPSVRPESTFEWLSLMQHYGVPTRLLDVTSSPFIALYFAVRDWAVECDAAVWAFNPTQLHEVSLYRLRQNGFPQELPSFPSFHMPEFIADEYFTAMFMKNAHRIVALLEPAWADLRLANQQGAFLISGVVTETLEETLIDVLLDESYMDPPKRDFLKRNAHNWSVVKLVIPSELKKKLFLQLRSMNIHGATLFPGMEGAALSIRELGSAGEWLDEKWRFTEGGD